MPMSHWPYKKGNIKYVMIMRAYNIHLSSQDSDVVVFHFSLFSAGACAIGTNIYRINR